MVHLFLAQNRQKIFCDIWQVHNYMLVLYIIMTLFLAQNRQIYSAIFGKCTTIIYLEKLIC
jgi:hypothetical protein